VEEPTPPHEPQAATSAGEIVAERYRIEAILGQGGMGVVYRAEHLYLRKTLALKVLLPAWSSMPEVVARFEREAVAAGNIQSPHVAAASDFGRLSDGSFFLVMEYVNGRTLRSALETGPLEPTRALHIVRQVASALQAAHGIGIVHRDLKPENVMLVERSGDADFVKVLDFGIAKVDVYGGAQEGPSKALTQVGAVIGTPHYMSPEQALGQRVDARSDLYSVGVLLYEMLAGHRPFEGGAMTVLQQHVMGAVPELPTCSRAGLDPRLGALLRRLLAKSPENRFASATELAAAIDEWCQAASADTEKPPAFESVPAMATPMARRVRASVFAGLRAAGALARHALADPKGMLHRAMGERRVVASILVAALATMILLTVFWSGSLDASSAAEPPTSSRPRASSPSGPGRSFHRAGSRGVNVPPPSQWFR
jgi:serine/threonine-protein kinase